MNFDQALVKGFATGIATVIAFGIIFVLGKLAGGGVIKQSDRMVLRMGWVVRGCAVLCAVVTVLALVGFVADEWTGWMGPKKGNFNPLLIFVGLGLFFGLPLAVEGYRRQLTVTDEGLTPRGWFGTDPTIRWEEITNIQNIPMASKFYVRTATKRFAVSHYLSGLEVFEEECIKRLAPAVYGDSFGK